MNSPEVRRIDVPPAARARSTLARVDYADAHVLPSPPERDWTPEQWARTIFDDAPLPLRGRLVAGWTALGLKLAPTRSDGYILGWAIRRSTPDHVLLGAGSRIGMPGELLLERWEGGLLFATLVHHGNAVARATWASVERVHLSVVPQVLESGLRRARSAPRVSAPA